MKVTCTKCSNSWELTKGDMPAGNEPFETVCGQCGSAVSVSRNGDKVTSGAAAAPSAGQAAAQWYVAFGRERKGPFDAEAVKKMISAGEIQAAGFVWRQGFESWTKVSDIADFAGCFAATAPAAGSGQGAVEGDDGMVWQRRETSVLFSLDDYKQRKATRGATVIKESDVVDVRPLDEEPAPVRSASSAYSASGIGMISFDETDVQRVADVLARKKKARRRVLSAIIAVAVLVLVGVGGFVATQMIAKSDKKIVSAPPVTAVASNVAGQAAVQPPAQEKAATQAAPAQQAEPAVENKAVESGKAEVAVEQDEKQKVDKPDTRTAKEIKADAKAAKELAKEAKEAKAAKEQAKAEKQGESDSAKAKSEEKAVVKQAPVPGGNDASSLLAQLHKGKGGADKEEKAVASSGSGLPERLTVAQVSGSFSKKKDAFRSCVVDAGEELPFKAQAKVEIEGSGKVAGVSLSGAAASRGCLEGALRAVTFDKFSGPNMKVPYTVSVR